MHKIMALICLVIALIFGYEAFKAVVLTPVTIGDGLRFAASFPWYVILTFFFSWATCRFIAGRV